MKRTSSIVYLVLAIGFLSCYNAAETDAEPDEIFFDYRITGDEDNDSVTVILKFRAFGEYGEAVSIGDRVQLDGRPLQLDSTEMTGPFYITNRLRSGFSGSHTITVKLDNKEFREKFQFRSFNLTGGISDTISRDRIVLQFEGLDKKDFVRVIMTDTSFTGEGINRLDTVWNNKLVISRGDMSFFEPGPINMELVRELERPLEKRTAAGGFITITYTLRREFWLKE